MERFGYPDFVTASADELIEAQYADRPHLRPIYEAIVAATRKLGDFVIQARKGYVSLVTPRRTFARGKQPQDIAWTSGFVSMERNRAGVCSLREFTRR